MRIVFNPDFDRLSGDNFQSLAKPSAFFNRAVRFGDCSVRSSKEFIVTPEDLFEVHDRDFVMSVLDHKVPNGYGEVSGLLNDHARRLCGVMVQGALWAYDDKATVCAPTQGFHHAGYDYCGGYCTFNGIALAIKALRDQRCFDGRILIIDADAHFGDGTADILEHVDLGDVVHRSYEQHNYPGARMLPIVIKETKPDLIIYQAGADAHVDDPYKAGYLSDRQLMDRDQAVLSSGIPTVWNLAGGYRGLEPVLDTHMTTWEVMRNNGRP